jgi:flagellar protein FliO/FliZ
MELETYLRFALALVFVIVLIMLAAWGLRRFGFGGMASHGTGRPRRLGVVEVAAIDTRRRLVLVRRDDVEHLVLLGLNHDLVIESGIRAVPGDPATEGRPA